MQDEPTHRTTGPVSELDREERAVLELLLTDTRPGLWSCREVAQALGDEIAASDAVSELEAHGLIHTCHEYVLPTRAAARYQRRRPESNRCRRLCRPLRSHSATSPGTSKAYRPLSVIPARAG
jgi:hypothetical protein